MLSVEQDAWVRLRDKAKLGRRIQLFAEHLLLVRVGAKEMGVVPLEKITSAKIGSMGITRSKISILGSPNQFNNLFLRDERVMPHDSDDVISHRVDLVMDSFRRGINLDSPDTLILGNATWQASSGIELRTSLGAVRSDEELTDIRIVVNKVLGECGLSAVEFDAMDSLVLIDAALTDAQHTLAQD